jgi:hypothetical protein
MVGGGDCPSAASLFVYQQTIDLPPKHGGVGAPSHDGKDGSACSDFIIAVVRLVAISKSGGIAQQATTESH